MSVSSLFPLLLLCSLAFPLDARTTTIDFPRAPCPFVAGCQCTGDDVTIVTCGAVGPSTVDQLSVHYPHLESLSIREWDGRGKQLDMDTFANLTRLTKLRLEDGRIARVTSSLSLPKLEKLSLKGNWLEDFHQLCNLTANLPFLRELDLSSNYLASLHPCLSRILIKKMDLHSNQLTRLNGSFASSIEYLDISSNHLTTIDGISTNSTYLNISHNPARVVVFPVSFPRLEVLDMSRIQVEQAPPLNGPLVREVSMNGSSVTVVDLGKWTVPRLESLSLSDSRQLTFVAGDLPSTLRQFVMTQSRVTALPQRFFNRVHKPSSVNVSGNVFDCDPCAIQWAMAVRKLVWGQTTCEIPDTVADLNCTLGISNTQPSVVWGKYGEDTVVPCTAYGDPQPTMEWWLYRPSTFLGRFDPTTQIIDRGNATQSTLDRFSIVGGGALLLHSTNKSSIERYICVVRNEHGKKWGVVRFRLDYSDWYSLNIFHSVFWGAIAFCIVLSAFSFVLNITWILTRKSVLWWIQRAERLSRVRKMVEAVEKYRAKQMESLHDKYTKKVQNVRDNYHQQVEQLRGSYMSQAGRFRDYRAAQLESVTSHLESIRENYQQQVNRVRDYGSRRAEALWESYERQANRVRTFSLQHRLKLARQYKVKQRYLNKLLESFQDPHSPEALRKHEEEVRAALELPESQVADDAVSPTGTHSRSAAGEESLARSPSYYSLPEYVIGEDGELRPGPMVPEVRFTHELRNSRGSGSSREMGGESLRMSRGVASPTTSASEPSTSTHETLISKEDSPNRERASSSRDWY